MNKKIEYRSQKSEDRRLEIRMGAFKAGKLIMFLLLMFLLPGCYNLIVRISELPENTPAGEPIYISGNFNNWDPGDSRYIMRLNNDSVYEVKLPKGIGRLEYKFTRGDWSTVEKDICGYEIQDRIAYYGRNDTVNNIIESWNDLPKPLCPKAFFIIRSLPAYTPGNATIYLASDLNGWDPGDRGWAFSQTPEGMYFIEVPRPDDETIEYKITRGDWRRVETQANGEDFENRIFRGKAGDVVYIDIEGWKDRIELKR